MKKVRNLFWPLSKKKVIIWAVLILVSLSIFNNLNQKKQPVLQFAQVKKQDIRSTVSTSGTLTGKNVVDLKFRSSGKLSYINVKVGDEVTQWQTVAGLDTQALNIDLQQAYNTLRDKQAIAQKAEDDVKDHASDETYAQRVTRTTAQAARDSAVDGVKEAQRAFQDITLVSPISGVITQTTGIPGQNVSTSDIIAQVVDFSEVLFDADIDEADIGKISLGQVAEVNLDAYADTTFSGNVEEIIPQTKETSSGATVVTVRIKLNTILTPINGLSGQATIIISDVKNALIVPLEAVRDDEVVFVQTTDRIEPKKVKTGIKSDTDAQVIEGLSEGDKVLLNPPAQSNVNFQNRSQNPLNNVFRFLGGGRGGRR